MSDEQPPADRYIETQAWWIASEIARRNPVLRVAETDHDVVGSSLCVYAPQAPAETQVLFNRISGINIVGDPFFHRSWSDVFAAASPHEIVKRVEAGLMLTPPSPPPPTTSITIVHQVIAQVLATVVNERRSWPIRGQRPTDPSVTDNITWAGDTGGLPSLEDLVERWFRDEHNEAFQDQGLTHLWVLLRDLEPIAVFDMYGDVHTTRGGQALLPIYHRSRSITETVQVVLRHELP